MAMRRPRIKAAANLANVKRKSKAPVVTKVEEPASIEKAIESTTKIEIEVNKNEIDATSNIESAVNINDIEKVINHSSTVNEIELKKNETQIEITERKEAETETPQELTVDKRNKEIIEDEVVATTNKTTLYNNVECGAFKEPPKMQTSQINFNNQQHNDEELEDNVIHMDLQKSYNGFPMSPSKQQVRARMRPPPFMGVRRNSYVSCSPSPHQIEENSLNEFIMPSPRRERYHSTSLANFVGFGVGGSGGGGGASPAHTSSKYTVGNMHARTRTESTCSNYSDLIVMTPNPMNLNATMGAQTTMGQTSTKTRRPPNQDQNMRLLWRRDYESRCANGIPDKTRLKMLDLLFYNPTTNPMQIKLKHHNNNQNLNAIKGEKPELKNMKDEENSIKSNNVAVPQLKLNANNELVLDDKSLLIETTAEEEARKMLANTSLVFVDENTGMNGFYSKQKRTREWPHDETIKFYRCLQTVGTDFSLMQQLFPKRTRRELKLKFKKEERVNGALINKALLHPKAFNITELQDQLEIEELKREEEQKKWRAIQQQKAIKLKQEKKDITSIGSRALSGGLDIYKNENVVKNQVGKRSICLPTNDGIDDKTENKMVSVETKQALKSHVEKALAKRILELSANEAASTDADNPKQQRRKRKNCDSDKNEGIMCKEKKTRKQRKTKNEKQTVKEEMKIKNCAKDDPIELEYELTEILDAEANEECINDGTKICVDLDNKEALKVVDQEEDANTSFSMQSYHSIASPALHIEIESATPITAKEEAGKTDPDEIGEYDEQEQYIQEILEQIEQGGLMLVSSIDPADTDNLINEIYMIDKSTGDLCEKPLDLPDDILQAIIDLVT